IDGSAVSKLDAGERRAARCAFEILAVTGAAKLLVRSAERVGGDLRARGRARERNGDGERQGASLETRSGREHDEAPSFVGDFLRRSRVGGLEGKSRERARRRRARPRSQGSTAWSATRSDRRCRC